MKLLTSEISILIADDEDDLRDSMSNYFRKKNFKVLAAASGREAIELLRSHAVDIVIKDICMPSGGGDLLEFIKNSVPHQPAVILISGHMDFDRDKGCDPGAHQFLVKPFLPSDLLSLVNQCLSSVQKAS